MKKQFYSIFILSFLCLAVAAQPYDMKFGRISMAEMEMKVCPIDSSADAIVLFDEGDTRFEYSTTENKFKLVIWRHARLKILDKDALSWGNVKFTLFNEKNEIVEKLNSFKGVTYNLVNGSVQKEKVEKSSIFKEKKDENRTAVKISFPKVIEGSVIEYEYEIISDYIYNLQSWAFQYSIPVLYSKYSIGIPEYYMYNTHISGYEDVKVINEQQNRSIVFIDKERSGGSSFSAPVVSTTITKNEVKYNENVRIFTAQNVPALEDEAYVDNIDNYLTKVNFELSWKRFPGEMRKDYALSWEDINTRLLDNTFFGKQLDNGSYLKDDLNAFLGATQNQDEKMAKNISFIKSKIRWNGVYGLYSNSGVKDAYKKGEGNSSDVNLSLVIALRESGFDAYPIALSTRSHGRVFEWQKTLSGFNHVIAGVKVGEKMLYIDAATSTEMNYLLPEECLNGQARLIDLKNGTWVDLNTKSVSRKSIYAALNIDQNSVISGSIDVSYKDYFALSLAEDIKGDDSLIQRKEWVGKLLNNSIINNLTVKMGENGGVDAKEHYEIKLENTNQIGLDVIYLFPMIGFNIEKNPFVKVERKFPVNFTYPRDESAMIKYTIPSGYKVDEIPVNVSFAMPENKAKFTMTYQLKDNELLVMSKLTILQSVYASESYTALRGFFDVVIKKQKEQVVLKKI